MENLGLIVNSEASTVIVDGVVKEEVDLNVTIREVIELLFRFAKKAILKDGCMSLTAKRRSFYMFSSSDEVTLALSSL